LFDLLGDAEERMGNSRGAIDAFSRKLDLKPYDVYANVKLGSLYDTLGKEDTAAAHFSAALAMERHDSAAGRVRLAELICRRGEGDGARRLLEGGMRVHHSDWMLRNSLGIAHASSGDRVAAAREFQAAIEAGGGEVLRYNMRVLLGLVRTGTGKNPEFIGPSRYDWIEERLERGRYEMKFGSRERAIAEFQSILNKYPQFPPAFSYLAMCYARTGQPETTGGAGMGQRHDYHR
jgi:tetratricopeptide (TPR) repeat protein